MSKILLNKITIFYVTVVYRCLQCNSSIPQAQASTTINPQLLSSRNNIEALVLIMKQKRPRVQSLTNTAKNAAEKQGILLEITLKHYLNMRCFKSLATSIQNFLVQHLLKSHKKQFCSLHLVWRKKKIKYNLVLTFHHSGSATGGHCNAAIQCPGGFAQMDYNSINILDKFSPSTVCGFLYIAE